ncbi:hypothetical protein Tco_0875806 [Tanacetum coccineum]|uniref:Uncharacterized protein n=1 Tax=Tanacetum coccineum TaxID=301880 RepID=A0ABQ5BQJ5_9ASTR
MKDLQCLRKGIIFHGRVGMWHSIEKGPYVRPMIPDPDNTRQQIIEPLSKMTETNKKQYIADVRVVNYILKAIPNDIYNSLDACKTTQEMWERIKRLMCGSDITNHVRHSRLMDEFVKFAPKEGESLESVYERFTTLVNIMDRNNVRPIPVSINTKFLNYLQPEWSKYVTLVRHNQTGDIVSYAQLYDSLVQFEPRVQASKAKRATRNHVPLALIAHSNASSSQSHASPSYSHSLQPYYVTHPSSVVNYEEDYQGELQGDSQEDKLTTAIINQAVIQDGRVDIQTKNAGYDGNGHYARDCQKPRVHDAKYFREQMLLAMKDEAGSNLKDEENDFMLDNSYGDETLEELTAAVVSEVNALHKMIPTEVHEHKNHGKCKTVVNTYDDDQINSNIIFDDHYVENNGGSAEHDSNAHDSYHDIKILAYNDFKERENRYLEDIVDLEEKLSSHDRIVYKIGQSVQTIHMLGKTPNKVYDPFLKAGLSYQNPKRLKKAIAAQPKLYHEDAEESRLKMRNKMIQLDYGKLNALYETFVPKKEPSVEQTYFSIPSTSNVYSESNEA